MICPESLKLSCFLETIYLPDRLDFAPNSTAQLRITVRSLERFAGGPIILDRLSKSLILDWMKWLGLKNRLPATVNTRRRSLLTLWRAAAELGYAEPPPKIPKRLEPQRVPVVWTIKQMGQILEACDSFEGKWIGVPISLAWKMAILLCWDTGCRVGTLLAAKVEHVDLEMQTWYVPAANLKGRRADRIFQLHPETCVAIAKTLPSERVLLFPFPRGRREVWKWMKRLLVAAGFPTDRLHLFHCIRRTAESYAAQARGIEFAAAAIGHGVDIARKSYVSPLLCPAPSLIDAIPRPTF